MAKPELFDHKKFLKLKRLLGEPGPHVVGYLEYLWKRGYQTGNPNIGDELDVEAAAEYPGDAGKFTQAAVAAGFIDDNGDGTYSIHDLFEHAPRYAKKRMTRKGTCPDGRENTVSVSTRTKKQPIAVHAEQSGPQSLDPRTENREPITENPDPRTENPKKKKEKEAPPSPAAAKRFVPPTVEDVSAYCRERGNAVDPQRFVDFYASKGWKVGSEWMKDWRASVRTWERRDSNRPRAPPQSEIRQRIYDAGMEFIRRGETPNDTP